MKELTIKEKAKAYDEALETARKINSGEGVAAPPGWTTCEVIFPELKESEDERISKEIIKYLEQTVPHHHRDEVLKSKEWIAWLEKQGKHANFRNKIQIGDKVTRNEDGVLVNLSQLKRVAKKDEKQGEQKPAEEYNITGISSNKSQGKLGEIIKNLKLTWSEGDENYHRICLDLCTGMPNGGVYAPYIKDEAINWLESLKDRVQPQPMQEWSEEDEKMLKKSIKLFNEFGGDRESGAYTLQEMDCRNCADWLKSIKERYTWKPSDEQIKALETTLYTNMSRNDERYSVLSEFVAELKKQKEE